MTPDGPGAPPRRALTAGLVLATAPIVAEALAVVTIVARVARELGGLRLYSWVAAGRRGGGAAGRR